MISAIILKEVREALKWFIDNDDTNDDPENQHWLDGLERGRQALAKLETSESIEAENREWLAKFLNYCPHIDPYDDEAILIDKLEPYTSLIQLAVRGMLKSR